MKSASEIIWWTLGCFILPWVVNSIGAATMNDTYNLHYQLFLDYNRNVRPINDQSAAINVGVNMYLKSIQAFDEVNEIFSYTAAIYVGWLDQSLMWDPSLYNGLQEITVSYQDIWVPELTLTTPASRTASIGQTSDRVRVRHDGYCEWLPANLIESTCGVNVRNYPFDAQSCTTVFMSLGYKKTEVKFTALTSTIFMTHYSPNALWDIVETEAKASSLASAAESEIFFTINMKRKSSFVVVNIVLPIFFLSLLNVFVFLLVPESGERIGYCITTLLAIAVYMTIVSDMLPQNSEPMPLISYKLMVDLLISAAIVFVTIINMRFWNREDDESIPGYLRSLYRTLACRSCNKKRINPVDTKDTKDKEDMVTMEKAFDKLDKMSQNGNHCIDEEITWKRISHMFDMLALIFFTALSIISCAVYIIIAKHSAS